ncbi:MAG: HAD-IIB family hydrolase [Candidatus Micrarchaeia archaeon]
MIDFKIAERKMIVCDLDGTLTESKMGITNEMSECIKKLVEYLPLAVIGGGTYKQFTEQFAHGIGSDEKTLSRIYLFPTCATRFYKYKLNEWEEVYSEKLTEKEKERIINAINAVLDETKIKPEKTFGKSIDDRETQITYSGLGQDAPIELKSIWDSNLEKRKKIKKILEMLIPEFEITIGGSTSIDITRKGIDKAYGIRRICGYFNYEIKELLFFGDALFEGGNDYPVKLLGVDCIKVNSYKDTISYFNKIIKTFEECRK